MRSVARQFLRWAWAKLERRPDPDLLARENATLQRLISSFSEREDARVSTQRAWDRVGELIEARQMAGTGPWRTSPDLLEDTDRLITAASASIQRGGGLAMRETQNITAQGATGDIELALQNVQWRREVNLSWLEFSRWGIQQLILVSRLHYIKNPWIQKGINTAAHYVFGRGFEVTSDDDKANAQITAFFERNKSVLGQDGLSELQKALYYDGQVFFCCFADTQNSGEIDVRTIDATEMFEIITNPDDTGEPWLYHRKWSDKRFNPALGTFSQVFSNEAYYPALGWDPNATPEGAKYAGVKEINKHKVEWDAPVLHMKGGVGIQKWHFHCPKVYAALDWAKSGREMLEHCATIRKALAQFSMTLTTKGGQQALEGAKAQLGSTVGPTSNIYDRNPPTVMGGIFASGPGTTLSAFKSKGAGGDPSDVKEYRNMVACVLEIPPTWLGDMETSNLSTAQTLDRPTELGFLEKQERWREVLISLTTHALKVSLGAPNGNLRESLNGRSDSVRIVECARKRKPNGDWVYESKAPDAGKIGLKCTFPAIREGDQAINIKAIAEAMTLDNKGGQIVGIDERVGVGLLFEELGVDNVQEMLDEMYPPKDRGKEGADDFAPAYDPARTAAPLADPIGKALPPAGGKPQLPGGKQPGQGASDSPQDKPVVTAAERFIAAIQRVAEKRA